MVINATHIIDTISTWLHSNQIACMHEALRIEYRNEEDNKLAFYIS